MTAARIDRRDFLRAGLAAGLAAAGSARPARAGAADLDFASAREAARAIRAGSVSSVELTRRMLDRIARLNPGLNAVVAQDPDRALAQARAADEALGRREWWGAFHGVPITVKDSFETAGLVTTAGAPELRQHVPVRDATVVRRLRRAGAVVLGKTNVPLYASDWQTYNAVYGQTGNPWDVALTPGGSTGGGAAALAAGLSFLDPGSDLGGSIRIPAHFCGLYGHKPSLDVVPLRGHIPPPPGVPATPPSTLPVAGPLARSAADLLAALEVMGGPDGDEALAFRWTLPPARGRRLADYRIGYVLDDARAPVSSDQAPRLAEAVEALRRAGAQLEEGWPRGLDLDAQYEAYLTLLFAHFTPPPPADRLPALRQLAASPERSYGVRYARAVTATGAQLGGAEGRRRAMRGIWQAYFRTHDAFLMPTALVPAFPHDHANDQLTRVLATPAGPRPYGDLAFWISFATLAGLPATTAPVGLTAGGLPVGLQIVGPYLEDATPIAVAGHLADLVGDFRPPPGYR